MVRLKKSTGLLDLIYRLEYGLAKDTYRNSLEAMRLLIGDENANFSLVERFKTSNPVCYDERKLYLDKYTRVKILYGGGPTDKSVDLYHLPPEFASFRDALVITYGHLAVPPLPSRTYCSSFIAITSANHLVRLNSETGELLDDIYLGSRHKFTTIDWETHGKRVVLQTNRSNSRKNRSILQAVCLMDVFPMQFVALFELDTAIVGERIKTAANVGEGLLILGPRNHVCIYDLSQLISDSNRVCDCKLYENKSECSHGPVGKFPHGLPVNFIVKSLPPPLLDVQCVGQSVEFGSTPFHYIYQPTRGQDEIFVADLRDDRIIAKLPSESFLPDLTQCFFHWDDTGRIIHQTQSTISVYKLVDDEQFTSIEGKKLTLQFTLDCEPLVKSYTKRQLTSRQIAKLNCPSPSFEEYESEIFKLDYENETEFLIILGVSNTNVGIGCIRVFDNLTGLMVRNIELDITLKDWAEYTLIMDMDAIVLIESVDRINTVFIFKLNRSGSG